MVIINSHLSYMVYHSLEEIPLEQSRKVFQSIDQDETDRTSSWLRLVEKTYPQNCHPYYFTLYDDRELVGLSMGTLITPYHVPLGIVRFPLNFLLNKFPLCNDHGYYFSDIKYIIPFFNAYIDCFSQGKKPSLVFMGPFYGPEYKTLNDSHVSSFISAPYFGVATLDLTTDDFEQYLSSLGRKRRQNIQSNIDIFENSGVSMSYCTETESCADRLFQLYMNVAKKNPDTESPFDLTPGFFREISGYIGTDKPFEIIVAKKNGTIIAFTLLIKKQNILILKYIGLDYEESLKSRIYFNLIYEGIRYGLKHTYRRINFGITSAEIKRRLGCTISHPFVYLKLFPFPIHYLVKKTNFISGSFFTRYEEYRKSGAGDMKSDSRRGT